MNVTVFSTQPFERDFLRQANADRQHLQLLDAGLGVNTVPLAQGSLAAACSSPMRPPGPGAGRACYAAARADGQAEGNSGRTRARLAARLALSARPIVSRSAAGPSTKALWGCPHRTLNPQFMLNNVSQGLTNIII